MNYVLTCFIYLGGWGEEGGGCVGGSFWELARQQLTYDSCMGVSQIVGRSLTLLFVDGLYCKRPIQCLASSEILTPTPSPPGECVPARLWCGGRTHSLGGEGVGGQ
jgi:hypothetical protein